MLLLFKALHKIVKNASLADYPRLSLADADMSDVVSGKNELVQ